MTLTHVVKCNGCGAEYVNATQRWAVVSFSNNKNQCHYCWQPVLEGDSKHYCARCWEQMTK